MSEPSESTTSQTAPAPPAPPASPAPPAPQGHDLLNVVVDGENAALNLLVGFIGVAQRRGAFAINESAKIYEALQIFRHSPAAPPPPPRTSSQ